MNKLEVRSQKSEVKFLLLILYFVLCTFLTGCATYKFYHGKAPYNKGYVVSRDDYMILEYTIGKDDTVPGIKVAKERFSRRKAKVEHYYKKMGLIENNFKRAFMDPPIYFFKMIGGIFRLPFVGISDYRYEHNPKYREEVKRREAQQDAFEQARIKELKDTLNVYVQQDLSKEKS